MRIHWRITGFICFIYVCIFHRECESHRSDVYIAGFFPYGVGVENSEVGRGVMPSVKLALDHVNEHAEILRNYRLHMWWNDTEVNISGVDALEPFIRLQILVSFCSAMRRLA